MDKRMILTRPANSGKMVKPSRNHFPSVSPTASSRLTSFIISPFISSNVSTTSSSQLHVETRERISSISRVIPTFSHLFQILPSSASERALMKFPNVSYYTRNMPARKVSTSVRSHTFAGRCVYSKLCPQTNETLSLSLYPLCFPPRRVAPGRISE